MQELCGQGVEMSEVVQILQTDHVNILFKEAQQLALARRAGLSRQ